MGNRRGILRESNRNASRCASAPKTAGEKLDGSSQAIVLLVAADTGRQRPELVAVIAIVTECRCVRDTSRILRTSRWR
jgi:hypothetical protein